MAERLERVRTHYARAPSLRAFWSKVVAEWPESLGAPVSYEAVRTWHYDRDAPATYLARLGQLYGVRLEWLIEGEGQETDAAATADKAVAPKRQEREAESEVFRAAFGKLDPAAEACLWRLWAEVWVNDTLWLDDEPAGIGVECAHKVVRAILAPLEVLDMVPPRTGSGSYDLDAYIIPAAESLRALIEAAARRDDAGASPDSEEEGDNGES